MKPDVSIDYYGLLGVQPNASDDEIKKAFRKQALLHHPDRNPGKEEEAKSKFQEMQAAYDTLSTPQKKQRYDQERLKQGILWQKRSTTGSQPPKAQQNFFRTSQPQTRPSQKTAGPSRYADYSSTSRDSSPFASDVNTKFQAFKAFEHMKGARQPPSPTKNSPPKARPAPTAQKTRSRSDWDESPYAESPRMSRSQSTRQPRRDGFNPYAEAGDEPSPRNASAYYNVSRGERPQASYPRTAENVFAQANQQKMPTSPKINIDLNGGEYYSSDRHSTPYASKSGEKTYFSSTGFGKSASTATNLNHLGTERARGSPNVGSGRFRSASPRTRSPRPQSDDETSSSEDDDESFGDRMKQSQKTYYTRRGSPDPRHAPKVSVQDVADEPPVFAMPKRQQTWDSEKFTSNGSSRTHYFPPSPSSREAQAALVDDVTPRRTRPNLERDSTVPQSASGGQPFKAGFDTNATPTNSNLGRGKKPSFSFSIPSSSSGSASPLKNSSAENVDTQFSPTGWHGQFFGAPDRFDPQQTTTARTTVRAKGSPPKRPTARTIRTSPPSTSHGQPDGTAAGAAAAAAATQTINNSSSEFGEWNKKFQGNAWADPTHPTPSSKRPIATPRSRNPRRPVQPAQPSGTGDSANPFVIPDDTGDEGDDEKQQSSSKFTPDPGLSRATSASAMDIDDTPPATRVSSSAANGRIPSHVNATSPNADFTLFPKPPPPSTAFNMRPLSTIFPMTGSSSAGLSDLKADLGGTLPFESRATNSTDAPQVQRLNLPQPPKPPSPPEQVTNASFATYMTQVAPYMREFHNWNGRMLDHFRSRQAAMEQMTDQKIAGSLVNDVTGGIFGAPGSANTASWSWMGARGDDGFLRYMAWVAEDSRVRIHFNVGWEHHQETLEKLGQVRKEMKYRLERGTLS